MCGRPVPPRTPRLSDSSRCLTSISITDIHKSLQPRYSKYDWLKLFSASTERKGLLQTLHNRSKEFTDLCRNLCACCITVVRDGDGNVFGSCTDVPCGQFEIKVCSPNTFLFKVGGTETQTYDLRGTPATTETSLPICIGLRQPNGVFSFQVYSEIERGSSARTYSFQNPLLSTYSNFAIESLEVYVVVPHDLCQYWSERMKRT